MPKLTKIGKFFWKLFRFKTNYCDDSDFETLFVRFLSACPNKCKFCFDANCTKLDNLVSGVELAKKVEKSGRKHIMISGGEPCLDMQRLYDFIVSLPNDVMIESLMTSLPKSAFEHKDLLEVIIQRCKLIDISTHGNSNEEDEAIYGVKLGYNKQDFIKELASKFPEKVFISCVMTASRFKSLYEIKQRLKHYYTKLRVKNFYFNEVGDNKPFKEADDYISIDELYSRSHEDFKFGTAFSDGCKIDLSKTFIEDFPGIMVKCRRRCFRCGAGDNLSWRDVIKQWIQAKMRLEIKMATPVLHGDGKATAWFSEVEYPLESEK